MGEGTLKIRQFLKLRQKFSELLKRERKVGVLILEICPGEIESKSRNLQDLCLFFFCMDYLHFGNLFFPKKDLQRIFGSNQSQSIHFRQIRFERGLSKQKKLKTFYSS